MLSSASGLSVNITITVTWAYSIQILFYEIARASQVLGTYQSLLLYRIANEWKMKMFSKTTE